MSKWTYMIAVSLGALLPALSARAAEAGLFLCKSPLTAYDFWNDVLAAQQLGIGLNLMIMEQIAAKDGCPWVASSELKAVISGWGGMLSVTDGKATGWAAPPYYLSYNRRAGD